MSEMPRLRTPYGARASNDSYAQYGAARLRSPSSSSGRIASSPSLPSSKPGHGYTVVRRLGSGSYGTASLVRDRAGDLCAMKVIRLTDYSPIARCEAFTEATLMSSLSHPYIVRLREYFVEQGSLSIVMDYADDGDLAERIDNACVAKTPFPERRILLWFCQVLLGLRYLHDRNILHRDLKTRNLFLMKNDNLLIGDFGNAVKLTDSSEFVGDRTVGTLHYLSPEVCKATLYSYASDVWALGIILHELCNLQVPFDATNVPKLFEKIMYDPLPALPSRYSAWLRRLSAELLRRDSARRPSCAEVAVRPAVQAEISNLDDSSHRGEVGQQALQQQRTQRLPRTFPAVAFLGPLPRTRSPAGVRRAAVNATLFDDPAHCGGQPVPSTPSPRQRSTALMRSSSAPKGRPLTTASAGRLIVDSLGNASGGARVRAPVDGAECGAAVDGG